MPAMQLDDSRVLTFCLQAYFTSKYLNSQQFEIVLYCLATNYGHVCVGKLIPVLQ